MRKTIERTFSLSLWMIWLSISVSLITEGSLAGDVGAIKMATVLGGTIFFAMIGFGVILGIVTIAKKHKVPTLNVEQHETIEEINWDEEALNLAQSLKFINLEFLGEGLSSSIVYRKDQFHQQSLAN